MNESKERMRMLVMETNHVFENYLRRAEDTLRESLLNSDPEEDDEYFRGADELGFVFYEWQDYSRMERFYTRMTELIDQHNQRNPGRNFRKGNVLIRLGASQIHAGKHVRGLSNILSGYKEIHGGDDYAQEFLDDRSYDIFERTRRDEIYPKLAFINIWDDTTQLWQDILELLHSLSSKRRLALIGILLNYFDNVLLFKGHDNIFVRTQLLLSLQNICMFQEDYLRGWSHQLSMRFERPPRLGDLIDGIYHNREINAPWWALYDEIRHGGWTTSVDYEGFTNNLQTIFHYFEERELDFDRKIARCFAILHCVRNYTSHQLEAQPLTSTEQPGEDGDFLFLTCEYRDSQGQLVQSRSIYNFEMAFWSIFATILYSWQELRT